MVLFLLYFFLFATVWLIIPQSLIIFNSLNDYSIQPLSFTLSSILPFFYFTLISLIISLFKSKSIKKITLFFISFFLAFLYVANFSYYKIFGAYFDYFPISIIFENPKNSIGYVKNYLTIVSIIFILFITTVLYLFLNSLTKKISFYKKIYLKNKTTRKKLFFCYGLTVTTFSVIVCFGYSYVHRKYFKVYHSTGKPPLINLDASTIVGIIQNTAKQRIMVLRSKDAYNFKKPTFTPARPKTVLLIINESWGQENLGIYSTAQHKQKDSMPLLSKLIKENKNSIVLKNHFTNSNNTELSVTSILSGTHPLAKVSQFGIMPTITSAFKIADYKTAYFSSQNYTFYQVSRNYLRNDFDTFIAGSELGKPLINDVGIDDAYTLKAVQNYIYSLNKEDHAFLVINTNAMHGPFQTQSKILDEKRITLKGNPYEISTGIVDIFTAEVFNTLKETNRFNNAFVWMIGDHGESVHYHNNNPRMRNVYDQIIKIPSVIFYPKQWDTDSYFKSKINNLTFNAKFSNTQNLDIFPTLMDTLNFIDEDNGDLLKKITGNSLLSQKIIPDKDIVITNYNPEWLPNVYKLIGLVNNKYRLIFSNNNGYELYNTKVDPHQNQNLWNELAQTEKALWHQKLTPILEYDKNLDLHK